MKMMVKTMKDNNMKPALLFHMDTNLQISETDTDQQHLCINYADAYGINITHVEHSCGLLYNVAEEPAISLQSRLYKGNIIRLLHSNSKCILEGWFILGLSHTYENS